MVEHSLPEHMYHNIPDDKAQGHLSVDLMRAWQCAALCYDAYSYEKPRFRKYEDIGFETIWHGKTDTMDAVLYSNDEALILAFRGTRFNKITEWGRALSYKMIESPNGQGRVHQGFAAELNKKCIGQEASLYKNLSEVIDTHTKEFPCKKFYITGHSAGGAVGLLSAARLLDDKPNLTIDGVYTYGQPRVGNTEFGQHLKANERLVHYKRMALDRDPFVLIPAKKAQDIASDAPSIYKHFGDGVVLLHNSPTSDRKLANMFRPASVSKYVRKQGAQAEEIMADTRLDDWLFKQHRIRSYVDVLKNALDTAINSPNNKVGDIECPDLRGSAIASVRSSRSVNSA